MRIRSACFAAFLSAAGCATAAHAGPLPNLVIFVGSGPGCDHFTLQAAVDAAEARPGADTIALANNRSYTAQEVLIADAAELTLLGGFDVCLGTQTGQRTVLDGAGGSPAPVIRHAGPGALNLRTLSIVGGDAVNAGGGVDSAGPATLRLEDVTFHANRGVAGGGLAAIASAAQEKSVFVAGEVVFTANVADAGGGLFLMHATLFPVAEPTLTVFDNIAEAGDGGGAYLLNAHIQPIAPGEGFDCTSSFLENRASDRGGGLFVHARGGEARVQLRPRRNCFGRFLWNEAGVAGGAIYAFADGSVDAPADSISRVQLSLYAQHVDANLAPDGGALMLRATRSGNRQADGSVHFAPSGDSSSLASCDAPLSACSAMNDNRAPGAGAVIAVVSDGDAPAPATLQIDHAVMIDNGGGNVVRVAGAEAGFVLADSLLLVGVVDQVLTASGDARVTLLRNTLAYPEVAGNPVLLGDRRLLMEGNIAMVPGKDIVRMRRSQNEGEVRDLMIDQTPAPPGSDNPPSSVSGVFAVADPGFVDPDLANYRLRADSPAIDRYEPIDIDQHGAPDLDLRPRGRDDPATPNAPGRLWDLGAYEFGDGLFADGFEGPG